MAAFAWRMTVALSGAHMYRDQIGQRIDGVSLPMPAYCGVGSSPAEAWCGMTI